MTPDDIHANKTHPARRLGAAGLVLAVARWQNWWWLVHRGARDRFDTHALADAIGDASQEWREELARYEGYLAGIQEGRRQPVGWCKFCGRPDLEDDVPTRSGTCGHCYYGMRLEPEKWEAEMRAMGRPVEYQGGCIATKTETGAMIACRNPYTPVVTSGGNDDGE